MAVSAEKLLALLAEMERLASQPRRFPESFVEPVAPAPPPAK